MHEAMRKAYLPLHTPGSRSCANDNGARRGGNDGANACAAAPGGPTPGGPAPSGPVPGGPAPNAPAAGNLVAPCATPCNGSRFAALYTQS